jgi:hypothetical protein
MHECESKGEVKADGVVNDCRLFESSTFFRLNFLHLKSSFRKCFAFIGFGRIVNMNL